MADSEGVDVGKRPEHLVGIDLHEQLGHALLHLHVVPHHPVHRLWNVVHHHVQVHLVCFVVASCVEGMFHRNNVGVEQLFHDLQLSVLVPLVLINLLDSYCLPSFRNSGLVHDPKGAVSDHPLRVVS